MTEAGGPELVKAAVAPVQRRKWNLVRGFVVNVILLSVELHRVNSNTSAIMGRELQKKKNRSSTSKVKHKPKSKKLNVRGNAIVAANW